MEAWEAPEWRTRWRAAPPVRTASPRAIQRRTPAVPDWSGQPATCSSASDHPTIAPLLRHSRSDAGRTGQPFWSQPNREAARQAWGWVMFTIQGMPNRSRHMPNSSPHICFSRGIVTVPPSDSFCQ
jgi:hypothetical protein